MLSNSNSNFVTSLHLSFLSSGNWPLVHACCNVSVKDIRKHIRTTRHHLWKLPDFFVSAKHTTVIRAETLFIEIIVEAICLCHLVTMQLHCFRECVQIHHIPSSTIRQSDQLYKSQSRDINRWVKSWNCSLEYHISCELIIWSCGDALA